MTSCREAARAKRGFTLIELLVVLALIALLTGLAALSAGAAGGPVTREARRLAATLQLATEESRIQGIVLGLKFRPDGYSYLELVPREPEAESGPGFVWRPLPRRGAFAARTWPQPMRFELRIDGRAVAPEFGPSDSAPQILLLPEGEFTPFTLRLVGTREAGATMRFDSSGRFELEGL
ncbi:MAG: type II secretion system minor pseudopilin GspH [Gammaproteobacteria bacterium]|nr:type II secretion system minor pseudopilin GspH [Gammaproteobacteria bacterium]